MARAEQRLMELFTQHQIQKQATADQRVAALCKRFGVELPTTNVNMVNTVRCDAGVVVDPVVRERALAIPAYVPPTIEAEPATPRKQGRKPNLYQHPVRNRRGQGAKPKQ